MIREAIERELVDAGWRVDDGFAGHLLVGNAGDLSVLVPWRAWRGADPAYELYDVEKHVACWVRMIPTPLRARMILEEHGESPRRGKGVARRLRRIGTDPSPDERPDNGFAESRTRRSSPLADRGGGPEEIVSWPDR